MIPIQLSLEGIYSYQKRQVIDFGALTDVGLFGIFGAVASGKSTILEAISFALYGESDRMNNVNRAYNMMNLKSDRMYIEFDFLNYENIKYRVVREYKRNSKNFENVLHSGTTFYEWKDNEWFPLDHSNAETIIGLSAENFKRTIIIPQGKFKEFIELGGKDRTSMMKEIFNLHHFDLFNHVRTLYNANEHELNLLLGKLSGYETVSEDAIAEKAKLNATQKGIFDKQLLKHKVLSEVFGQLKQLSIDFDTLQKQNSKLASEETRKKEIEESERTLKLYVRTLQQFDEILRLKQQLYQKIEKEKSNLSNKLKELATNQEKTDRMIEKLAELKPFMDAIDSKKQEVADLALISQILTYRAAIKKGEQRTINGRTVVDELSKQIEFYTKTIAETDDKIETIKSELIDTKTLTAIELWFSSHNARSKQIADRKAKLNDIAKLIAGIDEKFEQLNFDKANWKETIEQLSSELNEQLAEANKQKMQLVVKQKIAHFANEIHDGKACPLCGSLEHPNVIETVDVSAEIVKNKKTLETLEQQVRLNAGVNLELTRLQEATNSLAKNMRDAEAELKRLEEKQAEHLSLFVWDNFSCTNEAAFATDKLANEKLIVERERLEKSQRANRIQFDNTSKKLTEAKELLGKIEDENKYNETLIAANSKLIKQLQLADFTHLTAQVVSQSKTDKELLIKNKHDEHTRVEKQKNELLLVISAQRATIAAIEKQIAQLGVEQKKNNATIEANLAETSFGKIEAVEQLLSTQRNVEAERALIEGFKINYAKLRQSIEELEKKLEGTSFLPEEYEAKKQAYKESEEAINNLREELATLRHDLERIEKEYKEKKELLIEKEKLENRKANISTLMQLFKASGFVNYVSSIYLQNLCAIANERFHRLTKNQLSLHINDKNEFEIVDYLNDGHTRSVKTLSGGQNFQVSLSLALALAENVQSLTNSEKNFFFIDEGFGTQDAESVNIVFETLSNLQKGNRIVGIISHVEELQERIPKSLFIRKDLEKGSLIEMIE